MSEPQEQIESPCIQFDVFRYVRASQAQYGLKHADYKRYRQHCRNRLSKLRGHLKFRHGRNKFQKKELKVDMIKDERWLEMLLLEAESAWACALELKAGMEAAGRVHTNQRRHMLRRFAKARKAAAELQDMAGQTANDLTASSCDTYFFLARALELSEKESDPLQAAGLYVRGRDALKALASCAATTEGRSAALARAGDIDAVLRLSLNTASQAQGTNVSEAAASAAAAVAVGDEATSRLKRVVAKGSAPPAASDAEAASETTREAGAETGGQWTWRGTSFTVPHDDELQGRLAAATAAVAAAPLSASEHTASACTSQALTEHLAQWETVATALQAAKSSLDATVSAVADAGVVDTESVPARLQAVVTVAAAEAHIERFTARALQLMQAFSANERYAVAKQKKRERGARPADAVKLFDALHKAALGLESAADSPSLPAVMVQSVVATSSTAAELYSSARCLFVAQGKLARAKSEVREAAALFAEAQSRVDRVEPGLLGGLQRCLMDQVATQTSAYAVIAALESEAAGVEQDEALVDGVEDMSLQEPAAKMQKPQKKAGEKQFMAENLGAFIPFAAASSAPAPRIFRIASLFEAIPVQPITLDTAQQFIAEPGLSHRCPKKAEAAAASSTMVSGFRSLFGF